MALLDTETQVSAFIGTFGSGLDHPECICCGCDGFAYAGGEAGQIYRIDLDRRDFEEIANVGGGFVGGIAQDGRRNLYACSGDVKRISADGTVSLYFDGTGQDPLSVANYPVFDGHGNLYVSHSGGWKEDNGCIFKIAPGGREGEVWCRSLSHFPNGLALDAAGDHLYVAMSLNPPRVDRVEIRADGSAGAVQTLVHLPRTVPDGLAFDAEGNLYISCYRPDIIYPPHSPRPARRRRRGLRGDGHRRSHQHRLLRPRPRSLPRSQSGPLAHQPLRSGKDRNAVELPRSGQRLRPVGERPNILFILTDQQRSDPRLPGLRRPLQAHRGL